MKYYNSKHFNIFLSIGGQKKKKNHHHHHYRNNNKNQPGFQDII